MYKFFNDMVQILKLSQKSRKIYLKYLYKPLLSVSEGILYCIHRHRDSTDYRIIILV